MFRPTSVECYNKIERGKLLSWSRFQAYRGLYFIGPATAGELHQYLSRSQVQFKYTMARNDLVNRLKELKRLGIVVEQEARACQVTGQRCLTWETVDGLPKVPGGPKRQTSGQRIKELENLVAFLNRKVNELEGLLAIHRPTNV